MRRHLGIHFESLQENRSSSSVEAGNSSFLSSFDRHLRALIEFQQGSQALSHFETWNSAFLLSCKWGVKLPI